MPTRETAPTGAPCWVDLMTSDVEGSRRFYASLLGWTADEPNPDFGGYFNFAKDGVPVGGGMASQPGMGPADVWSVYLNTDDAAKVVEAAGANGGEVIIEPMAVADLGTMAVLKDSGGAAIGLWQPGTFPGIGAVGDPGTPSWFELQTREYDTSIAFYRQVFCWDTKAQSDSPEFRYTTQVDGDTMLAGVMDASNTLPEGVPSHWVVYFGVDDTDAALAKVIELGGTVVEGAEDTPYGRIATAADPAGATFKLVSPSASMPARPTTV